MAWKTFGGSLFSPGAGPAGCRDTGEKGVRLMPSFPAWGWEGRDAGEEWWAGRRCSVQSRLQGGLYLLKKNHSRGSSKDDKEITDIREL